MNIRSMIYLTTIAKEGTLSAAGRKLGVSQPTLSVFLSRLEDELGTELFLHEQKRLIPTPAGKIYLDAAEKIIQVKERVYQSIYQLNHEATETLTIGATPLRGAVLFAKIFFEFSQRFPHVKLEIKESYMGNLREMVKNGEVNMALGSCYDTDDMELNYFTISKEEIVLGVPAFHPLAHLKNESGEPKHSANIQTFQDLPFILLKQGTTIRAVTDALLNSANLQPTVAFETNNNLIVKQLISEGTGIGFLPDSSFDPEDESIVKFSLEPKYYMHLCVMSSKKRILTEAERYLIYLIIKKDAHNPKYRAALNAEAKEINREFDA